MKKKIWIYIILAVASILVVGGTTTGIILGTHKHKFSENWTYDDSYHWHTATCSHEDEILGKAEHSYNDGVTTINATCTTNGLKTYTCSTCGKTKSETINATGHNLGEKNYDCNYGIITYTQKCQTCDKKSTPVKVNEYVTVTADNLASIEFEENGIYFFQAGEDYETWYEKSIEINEPNVTLIGDKNAGVEYLFLHITVNEHANGTHISNFFFAEPIIVSYADTIITNNNAKDAIFQLDIASNNKIVFDNNTFWYLHIDNIGNNTNGTVILQNSTILYGIHLITPFTDLNISKNNFIINELYVPSVIEVNKSDFVHEYEDTGEYTTDTSLLTEQAKEFAQNALDNNTFILSNDEYYIFTIGNVQFSKLD